jgi:hypothetical protein
MNTNLKVILAAASLATLASPVLAQSLINRVYDERPAANISNAHGSVAGLRTERSVRAAHTAPVVEKKQIRLDDAEHVAFPQQDNGN